MPPITPSIICQLINKINTALYYSYYLKTVKKSSSASGVAKLESLLNHFQTPDVEDLVHTIVELYQESELKRQYHGLHILGDIIFKVLSQVHSYLSKCSDSDNSTKVIKYNTKKFISYWTVQEGGIANDMMKEANILRKFVTDKSLGKVKDLKYV